MKNGTSRAVLVRDLFRTDGPFLTVANDFLVQQCGLCRHSVDADARFTADGFWCSECATAVAAGAR